jgi:hypothetical protein
MRKREERRPSGATAYAASVDSQAIANLRSKTVDYLRVYPWVTYEYFVKIITCH